MPENPELPDTESSVQAFRLRRDEAQKKFRWLLVQGFDILREAEELGNAGVADARAILEESCTDDAAAWESFETLEAEVSSYGLDVLALEDAILDYSSYRGAR